MAFDPDAFLASTQPATAAESTPEAAAPATNGFNPDAFLASHEAVTSEAPALKVFNPDEFLNRTNPAATPPDDRQRDEETVRTPQAAPPNPEHLVNPSAIKAMDEFLAQQKEDEATQYGQNAAQKKVADTSLLGFIPESNLRSLPGATPLTPLLDVGVETAKSLTTPKNIAITAGLGALGKIAELGGAVGTAARATFSAVSGYFGKEGYDASKESVKEAIKVSNNPDSKPEDVVYAWGKVVPNLAMTAGAAAGVLHAPFLGSKGRISPETGQGGLPEPVLEPPVLPTPATDTSIVTKIDSVDTKGQSPTQINAAVNEALIEQPPQTAKAPPAPPLPAGTVDYAAEQNRLNQGQSTSNPLSATQPVNENPLPVVDYAAEQNRLNQGGGLAVETTQAKAAKGPEVVTARQVAAMTPEEFTAFVAPDEQGMPTLTPKADALGEAAQGKPSKIAELEARYNDAHLEIKETISAAKAAKGTQEGDALLAQLSPLATRSQFFGEAVAAAKQEGSYLTGQKVKAEEAAREAQAKSAEIAARPVVTYTAPTRLSEWLANPSKGVTPAADGTIATKSLPGLLAKLGVTKEEYALFKTNGLDQFLHQDRVNVKSLADWMEQNSPKVESIKLYPEVTPRQDPLSHYPEFRASREERNNAVFALSSAQHAIETDTGLKVQQDRSIFNDQTRKRWNVVDGEAVQFDRNGEVLQRVTIPALKVTSELSPEAVDYLTALDARHKAVLAHQEVVQRLQAAAGERQQTEAGASATPPSEDAATGKYGVEPFPIASKQGWVDILNRLPINKTNPERYISPEEAGVLYNGPHFGAQDANVISSVRGHLETLPNGKKVFHVYEVQSDWGQKLAEQQDALKKAGVVERPDPRFGRRGNKVSDSSWYVTKDGEPIGAGYPTKEEAQARMVEHVTGGGKAITAHPLLSTYEQIALKSAIKHAREVGAEYVAISDAETAMMTEGHDKYVQRGHFDVISPDLKDDPGGKWVVENRNTGEKQSFKTSDEAHEYVQAHGEIPQEGGMRAAYDERLPNIMEKLTGDKGKLVDFGKHKVESSPVFKDQKASPKINVTARVYDITKAPERPAAFGYSDLSKKPVKSQTIPDITPKSNALPEPSPGAVLQRPPVRDEAQGSQRGRVEQGQQGPEAANPLETNPGDSEAPSAGSPPTQLTGGGGEPPVAPPEAPASAMPEPEPSKIPKAGNKSLGQHERAIKAQDPETFSYLQEQLAIGKNGTDEGGMTRAEYDAAVRKAVRNLPAKPAPEEVSTVEEMKKADPEAAGGNPPKPPVEPPHFFENSAYDEPIGPSNETPEAIGINRHTYVPGLSSLPIVGDVAAVIRKAGGLIKDNISDANRRLGGVLETYEREKSSITKELQDLSLPLSRLMRVAFTKKGIEMFGRLLMNGDIQGAKDFATTHTRYGPEFSKAIDGAQLANLKAFEYEQLARGKDNVHYLPNYFARRISDLKGLKEFLGDKESGIVDAALAKAEKEKGAPLTSDESSAVVGNLIRDSASLNKPAPGYLKQRAIEKIEQNMSKFYEPVDVAMEDHFRRVADDYQDRRYFGKDPDAYNRGEGIFGNAILDEKSAGRLSEKSMAIVKDNIQDRFAIKRRGDGAGIRLAEKIRLAQSAALLGQWTTAASQFGDIFRTAYETTIPHAIRGYIKATRERAKGHNFLKDIDIHEGSVETAKYANHKTFMDNVARHITNIGVGLSDQFNKGGMATSFADYYSDVVNNQKKFEATHPGDVTRAYGRLRDRVAQEYPTTWRQMFEAMGNKEYLKGDKMSVPAKQFLYSELSRVHPINPSGMAQGFHAAPALLKPAYGLKSYWLKQVGALRTIGYENMKKGIADRDFARFMQGAAAASAFASLIGAGQNVFFQKMRDMAARKDTDYRDAAFSGYLQLGGLSRYTIGKALSGDPAGAITSFLYPAAGLAKEGIHDTLLAVDALHRKDKYGNPTIHGPLDYLTQSELVRHIPIIGQTLYDLFGAGATQIHKDKQAAINGKPKKGSVETLRDMVIRPDIKK